MSSILVDYFGFLVEVKSRKGRSTRKLLKESGLNQGEIVEEEIRWILDIFWK